MALNTTGTILTLTAVGSILPFYSAVGLTQTLEPINEIRNSSDFRDRTVGGVLIDFTPTQFKLFHSRISTKFVNPPALDGIWPGTIVTVGCLKMLTYPVGGTPSRPVISGSSVTVSGFVSYRPLLTMMIQDHNISDEEWAGEYTWYIDMEEVGPGT